LKQQQATFFFRNQTKTIFMENYKIIPVETTYLEMLTFSNFSTEFDLEKKTNILIIQAVDIPINFYKFLYTEIGGKWGWSQRLLINEQELSKTINSSNTYIYVLYLKGIPCGFAEYQQLNSQNIELKYFGLLPSLTGKGYGKLLLNSTLSKMWELMPSRIFLQTCVLDSASALNFYQKNGFKIYDQKICQEPYPIDFLENLKSVDSQNL